MIAVAVVAAACAAVGGTLASGALARPAPGAVAGKTTLTGKTATGMIAPPGPAPGGPAPIWEAGGSLFPLPGAGQSMPRQLLVPDVLATVPTGVTARQVAQIRKLSGVRGVLAVDGGAIRIDGKPANVIGVAPQQFRSWTPPSTAADQGAWRSLAGGGFVASTSAGRRLGVKAGLSYPVTAATRVPLTSGAPVALGMPGVDAVVDRATSARLGLVRHVAVLVNAPGADLTVLQSQVRAITGSHGHVVSLRPGATKLPVTTSAPAGRPASYLDLYQQSAARYCPGLSWTVLAAIGEVESGNGANLGPSSAGALGPMQFMPSTWKKWGRTGFDDTGAPQVMNPFDAVPSAAAFLCANGAANGGSALYNAVWQYNHANWYVDEVLSVAREYAQDYG